jgi:hypothetical protein
MKAYRWLGLGLVCWVGVACSPAATSCEARYADDPAPVEPLEAKMTACMRAGKNLRVVCPDRVAKIEDLAKTKYETWCEYEVSHGVPLCPERLAKVKTCKEAANVCR